LNEMFAEAGNKDLLVSDYLRCVFESSPIALISLNTRLRIVMFNRAARDMTGFSESDVLGRRLNRIIDLKRLKNVMNTLRNRGDLSIEGYITKILCKGAGDIPVRLRISPLYNSAKELLGVLLMATNINEMKKLQNKLLEAERLAAITEMAIGINHEINNPLCSILGNTQLMLMRKDELDPSIVKKLESVERQISRIQEIAERLGRISKPVFKEYVGGKRMLDVEKSTSRGKRIKSES